MQAPAVSVLLPVRDGADTLYTETVRLQFGETHVAVLAGDPLRRQGQPPMDLHLTPGWREQAADAGAVDVLFAHGVPDMIGASIGVEDQALPLAGFVIFGAFEEARRTLAKAQTTLDSINGILDERSPFREDLHVLIQELGAAARSIRVLSDYLERHPEALLKGKSQN